ncbi:MAG: uracil-DNA glycosylase [Burkholderiaceae bacterium]|nr:MAG: uracil-DNA glycosylase [Burkholderiaceae bacterium]
MTIRAAIPAAITEQLALADPSWRPVLHAGLMAMMEMQPDYLPALAADQYLPTQGRMFAAFAQPLSGVRYVLIGEGPYPREQSATGVCFMDGAVQSLWSENGLSKQVNRATSLRNFIKMLLVADGQLVSDNTGGEAMARISAQARAIGAPWIQTLPQLQANLTAQGFLLLNATLVFRPHVPPVKEAKAWLPFLRTVLAGLCSPVQNKNQALPTLVLWGKIAASVQALESATAFPQAVSEHPYNLSFIANRTMQNLFGPLRLLQKN